MSTVHPGWPSPHTVGWNSFYWSHKGLNTWIKYTHAAPNNFHLLWFDTAKQACIAVTGRDARGHKAASQTGRDITNQPWHHKSAVTSQPLIDFTKYPSQSRSVRRRQHSTAAAPGEWRRFVGLRPASSLAAIDRITSMCVECVPSAPPPFLSYSAPIGHSCHTPASPTPRSVGGQGVERRISKVHISRMNPSLISAGWETHVFP